jgi:CheY-like chemotaxis protein
MKTILQVEDDPNDVYLFQHAMTKAGVTNPIQVAVDGQQAIDYLQGIGKFEDREKYPFPFLVLLDLKLPYVMGLDVLKWIRKQRGTDLTVLMLTASGEEADVQSAYRLGANGFLTKPAEASKLQALAKAIGDFWLTHNILPRNAYGERITAPTTSHITGPETMYMVVKNGAAQSVWSAKTKDQP